MTSQCKWPIPPFLSAGTFFASLHILAMEDQNMNCRLHIRLTWIKIKKKQKKQEKTKTQNTHTKNTAILFSVQVQLRIQEAFGKSCACCASPFLRFNTSSGLRTKSQTIWVFYTRFVSRRLTLSQHMIKCKGKLITINFYLKHAS